ncbi:hypothetical protein [Crateriforma spongiae]|uniref:hypothetical protein n=1 Tax=Crateriforma spongiae TaxID=2724528 RepID=UPI0039AF2939
MMQHSKDYFLALGVLIAAALTYQTATDWLLRPPQIESVPMAEQASLRPRESLAYLFPEDAWQRGTCQQLQMRDAVLLFGELIRDEGNRMTAKPVTVVYGRDLAIDRAERPLILEAETAEIEFDGSLNLDSMGENAPPIKTANLIGNVHVHGGAPSLSKATAVPATDSPAIDIRTSYISVDRQKIWTTQQIDMSFGDVKLVGRDLTLHLMEAAGPAADNLQSIVDRMELIYLDQLTVPMRDMPGSVLSMESGGGIEFDFGVNELTLHDSVAFVLQTPGQDDDRFDCAELTLTLRDPLNRKLRREGPLDWISQVQAVGSSDAPASLYMPSRGFGLVADDIFFDAQRGVLRVSNPRETSNDASANSQQTKLVTMRYNGIVAGLQQMVYEFDPRQPRVLGRLLAAGAGRIRIEMENSPVRHLAWSEGLEIKPTETRHHAATPLDAPAGTLITRGSAGGTSIDGESGPPITLAATQVNVDGNVQAILSAGGAFSAAHVRCDLQPSRFSDDETSLVPSGFIAKEAVLLDTPTIRAMTDSLTLVFQEVDPAATKTDSMLSTTGRETGGSGATSSDTSGVRRWVVQPGPADGPAEPVARPRPEIAGRQIAAKLRIADRDLTAEDLSVRGDVRLTHVVNVGQQALDAVLQGDQLRLTGGGGSERISLFSGPNRPARLDLGDGFFAGPALHIRPMDNVVEINEAGQFQMPTAILPSGLAGEPADAKDDGQPPSLKWTTAPRCHFAGGMIFDGRQIRLRGGVTIDAAMTHRDQPWQFQLRGDSLVADLTDGVQLRDMKTLRQATLARVSLLREGDLPVSIEAVSNNVNGQTQSRHLLRAPSLVYLPDSGGQLLAEGPGAYWAWLLQEKANSISGASGGDDSQPRPRTTLEAAQLASRQQNEAARSSPIADVDTPTLQGVHLTYYDRMVGSLQNQSLTFHRDVQIGTRAVPDWETPVDVTRMQHLASGDATIRCQRLQLGVDPASLAPSLAGAATRSFELLADGGVLFRSLQDEVTREIAASRAAYQSGKSLFTLQGAPGNALQMRQSRPGAEPMFLTGENMSIQDPMSPNMKVQMNVTGFHYGPGGGSQAAQNQGNLR